MFKIVNFKKLIVPIKNDPSEFLIKKIDKDKLYNFLLELEFNRLLIVMAISFSLGS